MALGRLCDAWQRGSSGDQADLDGWDCAAIAAAVGEGR